MQPVVWILDSLSKEKIPRPLSCTYVYINFPYFMQINIQSIIDLTNVDVVHVVVVVVVMLNAIVSFEMISMPICYNC